MIGAGGDTADDDFGDARLIVVEDNAGNARDIVGEALRVQLLQRRFADRRHRSGDVAHRLFALCGGDDDLGVVGLLRQRARCLPQRQAIEMPHATTRLIDANPIFASLIDDG
jgi:hypothetical protein